MRHFIDIILFSLLACSCVEYVNLNTEDPREVVVGCVLRDTTVQELALSWTMLNEDAVEPEQIREADVALSVVRSGVSQEVGHFSCGNDGIWRLRYHPTPGETYRLDITVADQVIAAETRMPHGFQCNTVPNPALIVYPNKVKSHIYPSRQMSAEDTDDFTVVVWFTGEKGLIRDVVSSHEHTDPFNRANTGVRFCMGVVEWEMGGIVYLVDKSPDMIEESDYIKWAFCNRLAFITLSGNYINNYYFPAVEPGFSSNIRDSDARTIMAHHPEYGAFEKDWLIWGPNFDIWPGPDDYATFLHVLRPSEELLAYLKSVVSLTSSTEKDVFTQVFSQKSPYTNIHGGRGIFGAATEYIEDYSDYDERMTDYYQTLHDNELRPNQP